MRGGPWRWLVAAALLFLGSQLFFFHRYRVPDPDPEVRLRRQSGQQGRSSHRAAGAIGGGRTRSAPRGGSSNGQALERTLPLPQHQRLKFNFSHWMAEADRLFAEANTTGALSQRCQDDSGRGLAQRLAAGRVPYCGGGSLAGINGRRGRSGAAGSELSLLHAADKGSRLLLLRSSGAALDSSAFMGGQPRPHQRANATLPHPGAASFRLACQLQSAATAAAAAATDDDGKDGRGGVGDSGEAGGGTAQAGQDGRQQQQQRGEGREDQDTDLDLVDLLRLPVAKLWLGSALQTAPPGRWPRTSSVCAGGSTLQHAVLLLARSDATNPYHFLEDAVLTFTGLAALQMQQPQQPGEQGHGRRMQRRRRAANDQGGGDDDASLMTSHGLQVALVDRLARGPFLDLWARLSDPYPLRMLRVRPWPDSTCFRRAYHLAYPGASPVNSMGVGRPTDCPSTLLLATSLWMRHLLLGQAPQPQPTGAGRGPAATGHGAVRSRFPKAQQALVRGVTYKLAVWVSRRNHEAARARPSSSEPPLSGFQRGRVLRNEGAVLAALQEAVWRWNDRSCLRAWLARNLTEAAGKGATAAVTNAIAATAVAALHERRRQRRRQLLLQSYSNDDGSSEGSLLDENLGLEQVDLPLPRQRQQRLLGSEVGMGPATAGARRRRKLQAAGGSSSGSGSGSSAGSRSSNSTFTLGADVLKVLVRRNSPQPPSSSAAACRRSRTLFELRVVDATSLPFYPDQVSLFSGASVLLGVHGSGLANQVWMEPLKGAVVEVQHNFFGNFHHQNLATQLGRLYLPVPSIGLDAPAADVAAALERAMDAVHEQ